MAYIGGCIKATNKQVNWFSTVSWYVVVYGTRVCMMKCFDINLFFSIVNDLHSVIWEFNENGNTK